MGLLPCREGSDRILKKIAACWGCFPDFQAPSGDAEDLSQQIQYVATSFCPLARVSRAQDLCRALMLN